MWFGVRKECSDTTYTSAWLFVFDVRGRRRRRGRHDATL
jgi:hypothetical protein